MSSNCNFPGLNNIRINQQGHLELQTSLGKITETAPYVYQYCNGKMNQVACQYALTNNKVVPQLLFRMVMTKPKLCL